MRISLILVAGAAVLLSAASPVKAGENTFIPEIRPFAGAYVPTGGMRDVLEDAPMIGVQLAVEIGERMHGVGSIGWAFSSDPADQAIHMSQYDFGVEFFQTFDLSE